MRLGTSAAMAAASSVLLLTTAFADTPAIGPDSNLPVPRFVSLSTDRANGRHGPGLDHQIDWIYQRQGLPLRVIAESGPWRRVVDPDGAEVWMHAQNIAARPTAYVTQASVLRRQPKESASAVAYLDRGVIGTVTGCEGDWRRLAIAGRVGWVQADSFWGADCAGQ